jgi:hypothetical protein
MEAKSGRHDAFTDAILAEAERLTPQQLATPLKDNPVPTAFDLLIQAQHFGVEWPPVLLSAVVAACFKDREREASAKPATSQRG